MDDMTKKKIMKRFFLIFFGIVGVTIVFMIMNSMNEAYQGSIGGLNETREAELAVDCNELFFGVSFPDDERLLVKNKMLSSDQILEFTFIDVDTQEKWTKEFNVLNPNMEREILLREIPFELDDFQIVPYDCTNIIKECNLETRICNEVKLY